ncbi:copper resistance CopC/CopD family protein [Streptomyces sp. NPDC003011]
MLLGTVLVLLLLGGAGTASAHAALRSTDPGDGTVLKSAPRQLTLTFTESVGLLDDSFRVLGPGNRRLDLGGVRHAPDGSDTVRATLPPKLAQGTYVVAWRVVSADSHPVSGAFTFSVGTPSPTPPAVDTGPAEDPATAALHKIARYLAYLAAGLLLGTAVFVTVCRPPDPGPLRRPLWTGWWTLLGATVALLVLRAPYESGAGPAAAFDASAFERTLTTRPGVVLLIRLALLPVVAFFLVRLGRRESWSRARLGAGAALCVALALTWGAADHASAGIQVPVAITSAVLHVLAMAVWLGGLAALLITLYRSPAVPARTVARFSRLAFAAVVTLVVTGVYQSWRGLGSGNALTDTPYGRLLTAKLAAVILLLAAARVSRRWTARMAEPAPTPTPATGGVAIAGPATGGLATAGGVSTEGPADERAVAAEVQAGMAVRERVPERVGGPAGPTGPGGGGSAGERPGGEGPGGDRPGGEEVVEREPSADGASGEGPAGEDRPGDRASGERPVSGARSVSAEPRAGQPLAVDPGRRRLRRSVLAEVAVGVVVLVISTVLAGTLPGRAAAEAERSARTAQSGGVQTTSVTMVPFDVGTPGGQGRAQITLIPGATGQYAVEAVVYGPDGGLSTVPELRLSFTLPAQDVGPIDAELTDRGGYWAADALDLPLPGDWMMKVTVRVSEIDQVSESATVRIG